MRTVARFYERIRPDCLLFYVISSSIELHCLLDLSKIMHVTALSLDQHRLINKWIIINIVPTVYGLL